MASQLVELCHNGDAQSLAALLTQSPGEIDVNLASEGGVTLLMHAIIGAGGRGRGRDGVVAGDGDWGRVVGEAGLGLVVGGAGGGMGGGCGRDGTGGGRG